MTDESSFGHREKFSENLIKNHGSLQISIKILLKKKSFFSHLVEQFELNVTSALQRVAPLKIKNIKTIEEPWKHDEDMKSMMAKGRRLWNRWKEDPKNILKREEWEKFNGVIKKSYGNKKSEYIKNSISKKLTNRSKHLWKK